MSTYQVSIGDRTLKVALRREGEQVFAQVDDGPEQSVRLETVRGPLRSLLLAERRIELLASATPHEVRLAIGGLEYQAEVVDEAHARLAQVAGGAAAQHHRRELRAPMPGLVVKVLCEPGAQVEAGQPLVVLQAMKMENELSLPGGGSVSSVSVKSGQTVEQGAVLLVVE
jgi:glutaconyl-CoA/methylmalonyl-CoA decarboxylase subunit gamma